MIFEATVLPLSTAADVSSQLVSTPRMFIFFAMASDNQNKKGAKPVPKFSRVLLFLLGMNLAILFAPRIGIIHDILNVNPLLSFFLTVGGIALLIWAFSTMYYVPGQEDKTQ